MIGYKYKFAKVVRKRSTGIKADREDDSGAGRAKNHPQIAEMKG